ncbi:MAG: hypothetical protein DMD81_14335 [Candidatus Rokuibacteriota bacterium]|nr:MAG: hypothetical protein DMD81_14335 [Candidatus Rokubacteria bacterium]
MVQAVRVVEAPLAQPCERLTLSLRDVRPAVARFRIPDVGVFRRDVEVAAEDERLPGIARFPEPPREAIEPDELGFVER